MYSFDGDIDFAIWLTLFSFEGPYLSLKSQNPEVKEGAELPR